MNEERDFKGVWIPKEIWLNEELTLLEKAIYVEIDSLDNNNHCYASNEYFAEFCGCSESAITKAIKHLKELNMIEVTNFDGRHRVMRVVKSTRQSSKFYEAESENLRPNNIANNQIRNKENSNTINSIRISAPEQSFLKSSKAKQKQSLYSKCVSMIDELATDKQDIREPLVEFLKNCLEAAKESGTPLYANKFKGKLNKLKTFNEDEWLAIIQQSLDNGWLSFQELKTYKPYGGRYESEAQYRKRVFGEIDVKSTPLSKAEKEEIIRQAREREARGEQGIF